MPRGQSGLAYPVADMPERPRRLVALAWLLGCCAFLASAGWVPAMVAIAHALRPHQLDSAATFRFLRPGTLDEARQHMWIIAIVSFLVIVALAAAALLVGRRALRTTRASDRALARLERGAVASLVGGLAIWLVPNLPSTLGRLYYLSEGESTLLASIALAGAVGSVILGGIAVRQVVPAGPAQAAAQRRRWRTGASICLAVAPLIMLTWFFGTAVYAQITIGFFLHFVF